MNAPKPPSNVTGFAVQGAGFKVSESEQRFRARVAGFVFQEPKQLNV